MVRIGVVGLGNIGRVYADCIAGGGAAGAPLAAVASRSAPARAPYEQKGAAGFADLESLLRAGAADAVVIALPTWLHASAAHAALAAGMHVMLDKPLALHKAEAERLFAQPRRAGQRFAIMFQLRLDPRFAEIRRLVQSGALGPVRRWAWTVTDWFRPEIYYRSTNWRGTWAGEGGGVLMNQCPHNLDLVRWMLGMPSRVTAFCRFGRHHDIEVEDEVTACLEYPDGVTGVFTASTGEAPGVSRLEIAGDLGLLRLEGGRLTLVRNRFPAREYSRTTRESFGPPPSEAESREIPAAARLHAPALANFVHAIERGEPLVAPAEEGLESLELANAMLLSTWTGRSVDLPLDGAAYERELASRRARSRLRETTETAAPADMEKSRGSR